jgi:hypothetical protein
MVELGEKFTRVGAVRRLAGVPSDVVFTFTPFLAG